MSTNDPRASIETSRPAPTQSDSVTRFLGGSPLAVLGRLILLSILVGVVLSAFGLDPLNILRSIQRLFETHLESGLRRGATGCGAISCSAR